MYCPRILAMFVALSILLGSTQLNLDPANVQTPSETPITGVDAHKARDLTNSISISEWLGPMAPIALSPFFGITCLSGMSLFGQGTFIAENQFISSSPVLNNQAVFWSFLVLTLLTSLPRLTKVSKPIAQVLDQIETYSGIITIIVIRMMATSGGEPSVGAEPQMMQMGFLSFSGDMLLVVAAAINIFVINLVKFFFEALIWLTPIPAIDAIFEVCNKTACATLMAIYAWSPLAATVLNLILFTLCAIAFRWVNRSSVYMRTMLTDPIWKQFNKNYGNFDRKQQLIVFPQHAFGPFPAKAKLSITRIETGWQLASRSFLPFPSRVFELNDSETKIQIEAGFLLNKLVISGTLDGKLVFSRRYSGQLDQVAEKLNFKPPKTSREISPSIA